MTTLQCHNSVSILHSISPCIKGVFFFAPYCARIYICNYVYVLAYFENAAEVSQGLQMVDVDHYWPQHIIQCVAKTLQQTITRVTTAVQ